MGSLHPIIAELEKMRDLAYQKWFSALTSPRDSDGSLPLISIASQGRKKTVTGWYIPAIWEDSTGNILTALANGGKMDKSKVKKQAEIVIASEIISDPVKATAEVVRQLHQHFWRGDRVGVGFYYHAGWRYVGTKYGCVATIHPDQPSRGYSQWQATQEFANWVLANIDTSPFYLSRQSVGGETATGGRPGSRMKKWSCGCTTVRCATQLDALCVKCRNPFSWAEATDVSPYV